MRKIPFKKPKSTWSRTWAIIFVILVTFAVMVLGWDFQQRDIDKKMSWVNEYLANHAMAKVTGMNKLNDELKAKLEASSKIHIDNKTRQIVEYYITKYFGKDAKVAEKIFTCESGLSPQALNTNSNGSVDRGIAQINSVHAARFTKAYGVEYAVAAHDIEMNLAVASQIYKEQGFSPWVCSRLVASR